MYPLLRRKKACFMKHLRIILGLTLIPLCAFLGSFVPIAGGNGMIIGFFLGIAFSCLFLTYGPGPSSSTRVAEGRVDGEDAGRGQCGAYSITHSWRLVRASVRSER